MLNIKPKHELQKVKEENTNNFQDSRRSIIKQNLSRDKKILISDIFPKLEKTIALHSISRDSFNFYFSLPFIDFGSYIFSDEDKDFIIKEYYHHTGSMEVVKKETTYHGFSSLITQFFLDFFKADIVFNKVNIDSEKNLVNFELTLNYQLLKFKTKEIDSLYSQLDELISNQFNYENLKLHINKLYEFLESNEYISLRKQDSNHLFLFDLDIDELVLGSEIFSELTDSSSNFKFDFDNYIKKSKLINNLCKKMKNYGYSLGIDNLRSPDDCFQCVGFSVFADPITGEKIKSDNDLVASYDFISLFQNKLEAFNGLIQEKIKSENKSLLELIKSNFFDDSIVLQLAKETLFSPYNISGNYFSSSTRSKEIVFDFSVPLNKNLPKIFEIPRKNKVLNSFAYHYAISEENIISFLKENYSFFKNCDVECNCYLDFETPNEHSSFSRQTSIPNTFYFKLILTHENYISDKAVLFRWLYSKLDGLDISQILEKINFNEIGISKKIEDYSLNQTSPNVFSKDFFEVVFDEITSEEILDLYKNSSFYDKTKDFFNDEHKKFYFSYYRSAEEYKTKKNKEYQSLKLFNLFYYSLINNPFFIKIKNELKELDYDVKIIANPIDIEELASGERGFPGNPIFKKVCDYTTLISIT